MERGNGKSIVKILKKYYSNGMNDEEIEDFVRLWMIPSVNGLITTFLSSGDVVVSILDQYGKALPGDWIDLKEYGIQVKETKLDQMPKQLIFYYSSRKRTKKYFKVLVEIERNVLHSMKSNDDVIRESVKMHEDFLR